MSNSDWAGRPEPAKVPEVQAEAKHPIAAALDEIVAEMDTLRVYIGVVLHDLESTKRENMELQNQLGMLRGRCKDWGSMSKRIDEHAVKCIEVDEEQDVDRHGSFACFYTNGAKVSTKGSFSIKTCANRKWRDLIYQRQAYAYRHGFGPPVGGKVNIVNADDGSVRYGYYTGRASDVDLERDELEDLIVRMVKAGMQPWDIWGSHNVGKWMGVPVCLDFGLGCEDTAEENGRDNLFNTKAGTHLTTCMTELRGTFKQMWEERQR